MNHVFVVADLNGDALDDIVVGDKVPTAPDLTPADRLTKVPLHIFVSNGDGTFRHAPELVEGRSRRTAPSWCLLTSMGTRGTTL